MRGTKHVVYMAFMLLLLLTACDNDIDISDRKPWNNVKERKNINSKLAVKISDNEYQAYYEWYVSNIFRRVPDSDFQLTIITNREGYKKCFTESESVDPNARHIGFEGSDMVFSPVGFVDRWICYGLTWFFGDYEDYLNDNYLLRIKYNFDIETLEFMPADSGFDAASCYRLMAINGRSIKIQYANSRRWKSNNHIEENCFTVVKKKEFYKDKKVFDSREDLIDELVKILKEKAGDEFDEMANEWKSV